MPVELPITYYLTYVNGNVRQVRSQAGSDSTKRSSRESISVYLVSGYRMFLIKSHLNMKENVVCIIIYKLLYLRR